MSEQKSNNILDNILDNILERKYEEVQRLKTEFSISGYISRIECLPPTRDFGAALRRNDTGIPAVIAEVKKASPSRGVIREDFNPGEISRAYEAGGAAAISVLTDADFFQGSLSYLSEVKENVQLPVLRKDFIVDAYQIFEARAAGADAILLIIAALQTNKLHELMDIAQSLKLQCLVEVHDEPEMEIALSANAEIVGINNRDLKTFVTDISTTQRIIESFFSDQQNKAPILVSESGIFSHSDMITLGECGVDSVLIGEALMKETDIEAKLRELVR